MTGRNGRETARGQEGHATEQFRIERLFKETHRAIFMADVEEAFHFSQREALDGVRNVEGRALLQVQLPLDEQADHIAGAGQMDAPDRLAVEQEGGVGGAGAEVENRQGYVYAGRRQHPTDGVVRLDSAQLDGHADLPG